MGNLNNSTYDSVIQFLGIFLCVFLLGNVLLKNIAPKLKSFRLYLAFSALTTGIMIFALSFAPEKEYAHIYWISQTISYLLEVTICIQLCKIVIVNNWYILSIFSPLLAAISAATFLIYSFPKSLSDVVHTSYIYSIICCFSLMLIWLLQGKFEGELERPYSVIAYGLSIFMASRIIISYITMYYNNRHWNIIGRLEPINEILLLLIWTAILAVPVEKPADTLSHP